jgi:hypothetical protein
MAGALFSRIKTWVSTEDVTYSDLNAEFDNILQNLTPAGMDDYSLTVGQMQTTTDPGEVGTENLATTLAGELARLRFVLAQITGETYWYESPLTSLAVLSTALDSVTPDNRLVSGRVITGEQQAIALVPNGAATTATVKGATTNLIYYVAGAQYTITTDVNITGLATAAAANNTCLVNDAGIADGEETKYIGEYGSSLTVDAMGTSVTGLVGTVAGFKINNGSTDEYFLAYVESTTKLTQITRGNFFTSADAPIPRIAVADNDVITVMKAGWIFAKTDLSLTVTYTLPFVGKTQPAAPASGDYWFDIINDIWKKYDGVSWVDSLATYIGVVLTDTTNTVAARTADYFASRSALNTVQLEKFSATQIRTKKNSASVSVNGTDLDFSPSYTTWDMTLNLDSGVTEAASTIYYLYLKNNGQPVISDKAPQDRRNDLLGLYHPHQMWRCVGQTFNDASSNLEIAISYSDESEHNYALTSSVAASALTLRAHASPALSFKFKNTTAAAGSFEHGALLPGTSLVLSSGSTLGTTSALSEDIFASLILFGGRAELAISKFAAGNGYLATTTAEGGAGAADLDTALYSRAARTSVPIMPFSRMQNNQTTAGTWAAAFELMALSPFGTGGKFDVKTFTGSGTWTKTVGLKKAIIIITGGGAGAGGADSDGTGIGGAGGGGAGGTAIRLMYASALGATETVTIGGGGSAGSGTNGTNGGTGTSSTFGAHLTGSGGSGGTGTGINTATQSVFSGGAGGGASSGFMNTQGGGGSFGITASVTPGKSVGGNGGGSFWGGGPQGSISTGAGAAGTNGAAYGAGGSGAACSANTTGASGGTGAAGLCLVFEFYD